MLIGLFKREGPADKGNCSMIEKTLAAVGGAARAEWNLRAAAEVYAAQDQSSVVFVGKVGAGDSDHVVDSSLLALS